MWNKTVTPDELKGLPTVAGKLFMRFYNVSGGSISHPNDHRRLNEFIRHCHARKVNLSAGAFKAMLRKLGCQEAHAQKLSDIYYYGRELLKSSYP